MRNQKRREARQADRRRRQIAVPDPQRRAVRSNRGECQMRHLNIQNGVLAFMAVFFLCCWAMACLADGFISRGKRFGPGCHTLTLRVDGLERTYMVHVPPSYDSKIQSPLVVMLHGGGGTAKAAMWETGWTEKADKAGFIAVFPNAMSCDPSRRSSFAMNPQLWNDGSDRFCPGQKAADDVGFIAAMLDDLSARLSVDKTRIFVTGFSNGASMSFRVGAGLSNRIAAIAPVAGACWLESIKLERPVPMLYITGKADPLNLIEGGVPKLATGASDKIRAKPKPPVRESILRWVKALDIPAMPASVSDANGVRTEIYGPGRDGAEVVYITVDGLGHTWAGSRSLLPERMVGGTSDRIKATDVIWDFFQKHARSVENKDAAQNPLCRRAASRGRVVMLFASSCKIRSTFPKEQGISCGS
jgi:polyhydroxybutyrate depolymerase